MTQTTYTYDNQVPVSLNFPFADKIFSWCEYPLKFKCETVGFIRFDLCEYKDAETETTFDSESGDYTFFSTDRNTFGNSTFLIEITDTSHYGFFRYSLHVKLVDHH